MYKTTVALLMCMNRRSSLSIWKGWNISMPVL